MARAIPPITILDGMLTSTTAPEPGIGEQAWSAGTPYAAGNTAILGSPSSTVTISIASAAVINWSGHGLPNGTMVRFSTTGALPAGLTVGTVYFIVNCSTNSFQVSETLSGAPATTTGSQSGTQTATAQVHRNYLSVIGTASTVTMTIASPCVITWNSHGLVATAPVAFTTTGALPTGLTANTIYYVLAPITANTFNVSATAGGAAINTSGSQSGVHTAIANPNIGNPPAIDLGTNWIDNGPTNAWAMFDLLRNTKTFQTSPLTVVLTAGVRYNSLALLGMTADSVTVTKTTAGVTVYSVTQSLSTREAVDWYGYFFNDFSTDPSFLKFDLPPFSDGVLTVTFTRASGLVSCGGLVIGNFVDLGLTQYEAESDRRNFSSINRDIFGNATLIQRRTVPQVNQTIWFDKTNTKTLLDLANLLNAVPAVWTSLDQDDLGYFEAFLILGVFLQFTLDASMPEKGKLTLRVEEI